MSRGDQIAAEMGVYKTLRQGTERALFAHMMERADHDTDYALDLARWIRRGSTLQLRDLVDGFGQYWRDLSFANVVDGIDAARAAFTTHPDALVSGSSTGGVGR